MQGVASGRAEGSPPFGAFLVRGMRLGYSASRLLPNRVNARLVLVRADEGAAASDGWQQGAASAANRGVAYQLTLGDEAAHRRRPSSRESKGAALGINAGRARLDKVISAAEPSPRLAVQKQRPRRGPVVCG